MPLTSLASQLKKLQAPQGKLLVHRTERPSFLFDAKEAANFDRDTFYELGLSGLEELKKLNPYFSAFEDTLFDVTSKNFERSIQTQDVNDKLNHNIKTFLLLLSPYFLIKPAHKALEWLINRYHVQDFNSDELMMCALPYHETMTFARLIQLLPPEGRWHWLTPARKSGGPLPKNALLARASSDPDFLRFVCDIPRHAIKVHGNKASSLTTLYAFYCSTVVGGVMGIKKMDSSHITNVLPSIVRGLSSSVPDYTAAAFVVIGVLSTRALLAESLVRALYNKISKVDHAKLRKETCLALIILSQCETGECVPDKAVARLASALWFPAAIEHWIGKGFATVRLLCALVGASLRMAQDSELDDHITNMKNFLQRLVDINFDENDAYYIFRCILINIKHPDPWCKDIILGLEARYPTAFDKVCSEVLDVKNKEAETLTKLMDITTSRSDLISRLMHPISQVRCSALEFIAEKYPSHQSKWLANAVALRLEDPKIAVVQAALKCESVLSNADPAELVHPAIKCLTIGWTKDTKLILPSISLFSKCPDAAVPGFLFATIPIAFISPETYEMKVLKEDRFKSVKIIKLVNEKINSGMTLKKAVWETIVDGAWPPIIGGDSTLSLQSFCEIHPAYRVLAFVVYAKVSEMHQYLSITDYINAGNIDIKGWKGSYSQQVSEDDFEAWLNTAQQHNLPVGAVLYFVSHFDVGFDFRNDDEEWFDPIKCDRVVKAFVTLVEGSTVKKKKVKALFEQATEDFLKGKFPEPSERLNFLLTVALASESVVVSENCVRLAIKQIENASHDTTVTLLMCLLTNHHKVVREATLEAIKACPKNYPLTTLFERLLECDAEIALDPNQISVFAYSNLHSDRAVEALLKKPVREAMTKCRSTFVSILASPSTPIFIKARLLRVLECVSSMDIVTECFPKTVCRLVGNKSTLDSNQSAVVRGFIRKLGEMHAPLLTKQSSLWDCIDDILFDSFSEMDGDDEKKTCPSAYFLNHISKEMFDKLPDSACQQHFVEMIISRSYNCDSPAVVRAVTTFLKKAMVNGQIFANILMQMKDVTVTHLKNPPAKIRKSLSDIPRLEVLETTEWKKGIFLLEQLQTLKRFSNIDVLLTVVFDILAKCLLFEAQLAVEYPKQLTLSLVVKACGKTSECPGPQPSTLRTDLVVQCIRASQDPHTHHYALLTLTAIANIIPDQVLHNIMDVFTFIGSTVLRQDDAYSLQIIAKLIEIIIPVLVKDGKVETIVGVIRVFGAAMLDVPEHRRLSLFIKLVTTIGVEEGLWMFVACVLESHTDRSNQQPTTPVMDPKKKGGEGQIPRKLEFALQLVLEFPLETVLITIIKLLNHAIDMPHDKDESHEMNLSEKLLAIFDVKKNTAKRLRNYKYILILFLSSIVSSDQFIRMMASASEKNELEKLQSHYTQLVQLALTYVRMVTLENEVHSNSPFSKYWKVMLTNSHDLLDKIMWLVPEEEFAKVILSLVTFCVFGQEGLKRKALELLGLRLSQGKSFQASVLLPLVTPIRNTALNSTSHPATRQAALFAAKLLIRHLAADNIDRFKQMLIDVTENLGAENELPEVIGSLALCLGELVFALKVHSIAQLSEFVPKLLHLITQTTENEIVLLSLITALQKIVETLFNFLSPYLSRILYCNCTFAVDIEESSNASGEQKTQTSQHILQRLKSIRSTLSSGVAGRVMVPSVASCFARLVAEAFAGDEKRLKAVAPLMSTLADSFQASPELSNFLTQFFLYALSFRADASYKAWSSDPNLKALCPEQPSPPSSSVVETVEPHVISTVTALVLKLSESSFRPFYHRLYDWAVRSTSRARIITFYRLSSALALSLRGLFVLFAGLFITHSAEVLQSQTEAGEFADDAQLLIDSILKTLLAVFTHDSHNFLSKDRFNSLMQPLVDQLEIESGLENYEARCKELLTPCIAHMAAATSDDTLWKQLNYQVLLKTRHQSPQVRLASLETVCAITKKLGEDFLPLLPETVPFLAELLEDSDENVEKQTHRIILSMESVLGEPIQKYF